MGLSRPTDCLQFLTLGGLKCFHCYLFNPSITVINEIQWQPFYTLCQFSITCCRRPIPLGHHPLKKAYQLPTPLLWLCRFGTRALNPPSPFANHYLSPRCHSDAHSYSIGERKNPSEISFHLLSLPCSLALFINTAAAHPRKSLRILS